MHLLGDTPSDTVGRRRLCLDSLAAGMYLLSLGPGGMVGPGDGDQEKPSKVANRDRQRLFTTAVINDWTMGTNGGVCLQVRVPSASGETTAQHSKLFTMQ